MSDWTPELHGFDGERFVPLWDPEDYPHAFEGGDPHAGYTEYLGTELVGDMEDLLALEAERGVI